MYVSVLLFHRHLFIVRINATTLCDGIVIVIAIEFVIGFEIVIEIVIVNVIGVVYSMHVNIDI